MKLKGISDKGLRRLAQMRPDGPAYSGSRELLLENTVASLTNELGEEFTPDEVRDWCDTINNTSSEQVLHTQLVKQQGFTPETADKIMDVLAWAAHEMLDYDYADERGDL